jgi:hypothetical protein
MRRLFSGIFIATALGMVSSCYYDNAEHLYGTGGTCDSTATWTADIEPMIQVQCVICHQGASASAGLDLSSHAGVQNSTLNGALMDRIQRGSGDPLVMPPGGPMNSCNQAKFRVWERGGALPN